MDISLCICTFRRPELLADLLRAIPAQIPLGLRAELIVVDNDPARSATPALAAARPEIAPLTLTVLHEATPNIALARNAAVAAAQGRWIAIIDDDELPDPNWLEHLMTAAKAYAADAVFGPVKPRYPAYTATWITQSGFFEPANRPSGTVISSRQAYSGNVLIRRQILNTLAAPQGPFDPEFGVTGGSDTMLFWELQNQGAKLIWCAEAVVRESVPASRLTLRWILRRAYRGGQSFVRAEIARLSGRARWQRAAGLGLKALVQLPVALLLALLHLPFSRARAARWLWTAWAQLGKLVALAGRHYREYAQ